MAIFDEYKQAIQDVLDGKTKEPPQPSAFPDEQDMLAALYAAAAALSLSKEAPSETGGGGVLVVHSTYEEWEDNGTWKWKETLDKTATELASADFVVLSNRPVPLETGSWGPAYLCYITVPSELDPTQEWWFAFTNTYMDGDDVKVGWTEFVSSSADGYPFAEGVIE